MIERALAGPPPAAIDLNSPGTYLHWSIFTVSEANLVLIAVMVVIFGAALLLPFPHGKAADELTAEPAADGPDTGASRHADGGAADPGNGSAPADGDGGAGGPAPGPDDDMWTARVRNWALRVLPPGKLLPDRQPA